MKHTLKQPFQERRLFTERTVIAGIIVVVTFTLLMSRYFYLQVISHQYYQDQAEQNRIKYSRINSTRGLIYDRNGVLLAENITAYRLTMVEERVPDLEAGLKQIGTIVPLSEEDLTNIRERLQFNPIFKPLTIREKLTETEVAAFAVQRHQLPGFETEPYLIRKYLYPVELSHLMGYVGKISQAEFNRQDKNLYAADDYFGKTGLEKYHEQALHGIPGQLVTEINAQGKQMSQRIEQPPVNGTNLNLTIDIELQQAAYQAFAEETGSAIAVDISSGAILAMVSKPGYDTNQFITGISKP